MNNKFEIFFKILSPDNIWSYGLGAMTITGLILLILYIIYILVVYHGKSQFTNDLYKVINKMANLIAIEFVTVSVMSLIVLATFGFYALFTYIF